MTGAESEHVRAALVHLGREAYETAKRSGFWDGETDHLKNDAEQLCLMHSELSEGLEALRKDLRSEHLPEFLGIEEELADVVIRVLQYAHARRFRLADAVLAKMVFNATRPAMHGGKKF